MAFAIASSTTFTAVAAASISQSFTVTGNGLYVGCIQGQSNQSITSITYNSASLGAALWDVSDGATIHRSNGYVKTNPSTGSNTLSINFSASVDAAVATAADITDLNTSTPTRTAYTGSGSSGSPTVTAVDSQSGDIVVDAVAAIASISGAGGGQTVLGTISNPGGGSTNGAMSQEAATGGNTVMSWSTASTFWAIGAVSLVGSVANAKRMTLLGVG